MTKERFDSAEDILKLQTEVFDEFDVRRWFMKVSLEQAEDTFRVIEGILEARRELSPKRKRRSDAGTSRPDNQRMLENT